MVRDTRKDATYWQGKLDSDVRRIEKFRSVVEDQNEAEKKRGNASRAWISIIFNHCLALYSSGAPIEEIVTLGKKLLCEIYPQYLQDQIGGDSYGPQRPSTSIMARYFALLVLSRPTQEEVHRFIAAYDHWDFQGPPVQGERDRIWEAYVVRFGVDGDRQPATGVNWPEAYQNLWNAIDPSEPDFARPHHLKKFLEGWYKEMASELAAQTDLLGPENTPGSYAGYWCLEAAAASVAFGIDDTDFRDHEHYPKDWADWARGA